MFQRLVFCAVIALSIGNCVRVGQSRGPTERKLWDKLAAPPLSLWSNRAINIATLGHRGLYEDFIGIWTLQTLIDQDLKKYASAEQVETLIEATIRQKPHLESLYLLCCFTMALDYDRPQNCEKISVQGLKVFPKSWRILMTQGFVAAFKLGDMAKASAYYTLASQLPEAPPWVASLAGKLAKQGQEKGQDLNETIQLLKEVPDATRLLELIRPKLRDNVPHPALTPVPDTSTTPSESATP